MAGHSRLESLTGTRILWAQEGRTPIAQVYSGMILSGRERKSKGGVVLKCAVVVMVMVTMMAGCSPSERDRQAAWKRAMQMELDAAHDQWVAAMANRWFSTNGQAMRDLQRRYELVYARWGLRVDPLSQAILAYAVALASRVDRGAISQEEANRLYDALKAEIDRRGRGLPGKDRPEGEAEAAMLQWWEAFWNAHAQIYQATPSNPIICSVIPIDTGGDSIKCE